MARRIITGKVRFSFPHLFKVDNNGRYSVKVLIPKSDKKTLAKINAAIEEAKQRGKESVKPWSGKIPNNLDICLRDGDGTAEKYAEDAGCFYIQAKTQPDFKPKVVDVNLDPIINPHDFGSGDWGRLALEFFPYSNSGKNGVSCTFDNIQHLEKGEPLSAGSRVYNPEDDFAEDLDDDGLI